MRFGYKNTAMCSFLFAFELWVCCNQLGLQPAALHCFRSSTSWMSTCKIAQTTQTECANTYFKPCTTTSTSILTCLHCLSRYKPHLHVQRQSRRILCCLNSGSFTVQCLQLFSTQDVQTSSEHSF